MTEKRFTINDCRVLSDEQVFKILNQLTEENEQLKQEYQKLKHRHSLLYDVCLDAECERDSLKKDVKSLEKENKELKEENIAIKKTLHTIINQINVDKINNNKAVYSARILFKEKEFQFIYDIYKKSLEEL